MVIYLDNFLNSFFYMGVGMLGIFIVAAILIVSVVLLNKVTKPKKKDKQ